jgi:hypothetical protein
MSNLKQLTAIVYCSVPQVNGNNFLKYRNISDTDKAKGKFLLFAAKFPGAEYVNWYDKKTKAFIERVYLK